jgi:hypothetical protein
MPAARIKPNKKPRRNLTEQMLEVLNDLIHAASIRWRAGAIYGQLAGAFCGKSEIPLGWIERLAMHEFIREMADALFSFSIAPNSHHF